MLYNMLLPPEEVSRKLIASYAAVRSELGKEWGDRRLVLPNADFFPDEFSADQKGATRLVRRMQAHAGMTDIPIRPAVFDQTPVASAGSSCSSKDCAPATVDGQLQRVVDEGDEWRVQLASSELRHPVALTTTLARALAQVMLAETVQPDYRSPVPGPVLVDFVGVGLGFGALLMEGAYIYHKSCGGPNVTQLTALGVPELALCVALFAVEEPRALKRAERALGTTQCAALADARAWLNGNRSLALQVKRAPELASGGVFELKPPRTAWFGWFDRKSATAEEPWLLEATRPNAPASSAARKKPRPVDDDLKALVTEALSSPGSTAE